MSSLFLPSSGLFLAVVVLAGLLLRSHKRSRWLRHLTIGLVGLLAVAAIGPLGNWLLFPLERRFPVFDAQRLPKDISAIVILGGVSSRRLVDGRDDIDYAAAIDRVTFASQLAQAFPTARVIVCGGADNSDGDAGAEAHIMERLMVQLGVAPDRFLRDTRSRSTAENARNAKALVAGTGQVLLVTSAFHMPRAIGAFRAENLTPIAAPTDWRISDEEMLLTWTSPGEGLSKFDIALHEYGGLLVYWLSGRSTELFPGP